MSTREQRRIYGSRYYNKHRESILAKGRAKRLENIEAERERSRNYYRRNVDAERYRQFRRLYGITPTEYDELLAEQNGLCAICRRPPRGGTGNRLHTDHDHRTGAMRGLLCHGCNWALGAFGDSLEGVQRAVDYLLRDSPRPAR